MPRCCLLASRGEPSRRAGQTYASIITSGRKRYTDARSVLSVAIMANPMAVDTDAVLETMTTNLLQVSSVFLMQQNELQEVRDRLAKELKRVDTILETLTQAAQPAWLRSRWHWPSRTRSQHCPHHTTPPTPCPPPRAPAALATT